MEWEEALLDELPRGVAGRDAVVPGARWSEPGELGEAWAYKRSSIFLGYRDGRGIGSTDDRHVLLCSGSRSGKGVSVIVPNLLLYSGSVLAIDPKGELARITARRRTALGQRIVVLDPFGTTGAPPAHFNPLAEIDPTALTAVDDAALLAEALVVQEGQGGEGQHWVNGARELIKGLILFALTLPLELRHLGTVREFFRTPAGLHEGKTIPGHRVALQGLANAGDAFGGLVAGIGNSFLGKDERELSGLISTADVQLGFLDSPPLTACLTRSDFKLSELKTSPMTVYLCLPASRMATHAKWLRAIINLSLAMCERVKKVPSPPLVFMLDEFPVLGHMRTLETAAGQIAGFGVKLFTVVQDLTQLQRLYKESWQTFIGNAGVSIFFGNSDAFTLDYVSKKLGTIGFDVLRATSGGSAHALSGAKLFQEQLQLTKLLEPHEIELTFARERERALILSPGEAPIILQRAKYYEDDAFKGMFDR